MRNVWRCTAYRSCRRHAVYFHPDFWCTKHWKMWWSYSVKDKPRNPAFISKSE